MGEPHLYSVDSLGETTPPAAPSGPAAPTGGTKTDRAPQKNRPKYPVPTDRMKFDTQVDALRVICTASRGGNDPVNAQKMGTLLRLTPATAPLNNAFFLECGLIERLDRGEYKPTAEALAFANKWSFDKSAAPRLLAPALRKTWFFEAVTQQLEVSPTTREQMIETLALVAQTDSSYSTQYGFILDWLEFVGLIKTEGGTIVLTASPESPAPGAEPTIAGGSTSVPRSDPSSAPTKGPIEEVISTPPIISFSFEVSLDAAALAQLSPEQISALFDGVGKVASIKAALGRE